MPNNDDINNASAPAGDGRGRPRQHPLLKTHALGCALPAWVIKWLGEEAVRRKCSRAQLVLEAIVEHYKPPGVRILASGDVVARKTRPRKKQDDS